MKGHTPHKLECFPHYFSSLDSIVHYTCNSPSLETLDKHSINPIGEKFDCAYKEEVLEIPVSLYEKFGFSELQNKEVMTINLEKIMRELK